MIAQETVAIAPPVTMPIPKPKIRSWVTWAIVLGLTNVVLWWLYLAPDWTDLPGV